MVGRIKRNQTPARTVWCLPCKAGLILAISIILISSAALSAQQKGQWVPGQVGLNAGILPDPGVTYASLTINYSASTLNNAAGEFIPVDGNYSFWVTENVLYYVPKVKVLGGKLAVQIMLPVANGSPTYPAFGIHAGGAGYADTWMQPVTLGWDLKRVSTWIAYAFMAPTGRFTPGAPTNVGSGYWGNNLVSRTTVNLTRNQKTTANLTVDWEIHGRKSGTHENPGPGVHHGVGVGQLVSLDAKMRSSCNSAWLATTNGRLLPTEAS